MAGYTRQDTANNIANGNVIDADDLDIEFNGVEAAFNAGTGHKHDGSAGEGAPITVIGPVQDIVATTTVLRPKTTNTVDLGTTTIRYKDAYLSGDLYVGDAISATGAATLGSTLAVTGNTTVGGTLGVTGATTLAGNVTLGDAATDTVNFVADVASNLIPHVDDTYDLGAVSSEWRNLYIDGIANIDTAAIDTANVGTLAVSGNGTVTGSLTVVGGINATITGTATSANTLTTARTITLGGDLSGAANFDGSANITITAAVADDSHNHVIANVDGLQTALDGKLSTSGKAADSDLLDGLDSTSFARYASGGTLSNALADNAWVANYDGTTNVDHIWHDDAANAWNFNSDSSFKGTANSRINAASFYANNNVVWHQGNDGAGSGLDADLLDGVQGSSYLRSDTSDTFTGTLTVSGNIEVTGVGYVGTTQEGYTALSGTTPSIDADTAGGFALTTSGNTTFTFAAVTSSRSVGFVLKLTAGGTHTITWPASVDWAGGTAPDAPASGETDVLVFWTVDGGTTWYGARAIDAAA